MQAPVETPLKRASVSSATCLPKSRYSSAEVTWNISSMPEPIGPRQISTTISPGLIPFGPGSLIDKQTHFPVAGVVADATAEPSGLRTPPWSQDQYLLPPSLPEPSPYRHSSPSQTGLRRDVKQHFGREGQRATCPGAFERTS